MKQTYKNTRGLFLAYSQQITTEINITHINLSTSTILQSALYKVIIITAAGGGTSF
jgi:hypothetical protein